LAKETKETGQRVAWVVGGSAGFGLAVAEALVVEGFRVVIFARDVQRLEQARGHLIAVGGGAVAAAGVFTEVLDARDADAVGQVFQRRMDVDERLDVLVNAVGQSCRTSVLEPDLTLYSQMMEVNYFAVVNTTLQALPWLLASRGSLVNVASLAAKTAWPWMAPYGAAKAAVASFTANVRLETAGRMHVLLVCPGPIARDESDDRYRDQTEQLEESAKRPGAGAPVRALCPRWLAGRVIWALKRQRPSLIYPRKARLLFLIEACSSRCGARLLGWLTRKSLRS